MSADGRMSEERLGDREISVEVLSGVEGPSVYLADCRIAGNKPWGGGRITHSWKTTVREVFRALGLMPWQDSFYSVKENPERMPDARFAAIMRYIAVDPDTPFDRLFLEVRDALLPERTALATANQKREAAEGALRSFRELAAEAWDCMNAGDRDGMRDCIKQMHSLTSEQPETFDADAVAAGAEHPECRRCTDETFCTPCTNPLPSKHDAAVIQQFRDVLPKLEVAKRGEPVTLTDEERAFCGLPPETCPTCGGEKDKPRCLGYHPHTIDPHTGDDLGPQEEWCPDPCHTSTDEGGVTA